MTVTIVLAHIFHEKVWQVRKAGWQVDFEGYLPALASAIWAQPCTLVVSEIFGK